MEGGFLCAISKFSARRKNLRTIFCENGKGPLPEGTRNSERGVRAVLTRNSLLPKLQAMPTVLRIGPYRFHFYSREGNEPPHIHVTREDMEAKFWLRPVVLAANHGFATAELARIQRLVEEHCQTLTAA